MPQPQQKPEQLTGLTLVIATFAIAMANFMNVLDTTISVVSVPTIAGALGATPSQGTWVITIYAVSLAVILPLAGWITRRYGQVRVFITALITFTLMSTLCGMATNFDSLLVFRALQGLSGGLMLPLSQSLLVRIFPPEKQGKAISIWGLTSAVAPVAGPVLGGYITDNYGWPWIFYINIPLGLVCAYFCRRLLGPFETPRVKLPIDIPGLVLLVVCIFSLQIMLDRGHELDWLASETIQVLAVIFACTLALFIAWERDEANPVVDFSVFSYPGFLLGSLAATSIYTCLVVSLVVFPIWLQTMMDLTSSITGLILAPTSAAAVILMPVISKKLGHLDPRPMIFIGTLAAAAGLYLHTLSFTTINSEFIAWSRVLFGLGMPLAFFPLLTLSFANIPPEKMPGASGINNFMRMLGASAGTAVGITLWENRTIYHHSQLTEMVSPNGGINQTSWQSMQDKLPSLDISLQLLEREIQRQATTLALNDLFIAGIILLAPIFAILLFIKPKKMPKAPAKS
ncbi:DHA2 family efflux MFS transporter permease subunit [Thalassomonas haliotis]|uniref:DHA2 family efflux MFS transporter permease subunit n=1 Tax=Thalassomonas haliotis TaxID=485448 RepID=A0ABY7VEA0_9GAMM|nr:DHA2 family efflux MFS transporter permease subunit [Thalassomonas haliotis]WDE11999.1 DHA2 family efflux MFS transporter permease subunit [Thalassomonas haliotis]